MRLEGKDLEDATKINEVIAATSDWPEGTFLVRWVVVADWMTPDGERHLSSVASDGATCWEIDGLLEAGLHQDEWTPPKDDDE